MELRDYVHLYLGNPFKYIHHNGLVTYGVLENINKWGFVTGYDLLIKGEEGNYDIELWETKYPVDFKLLLEPLSKMTQGQERQYHQLCKKRSMYKLEDTPLSLHYLLRWGFDIFNLIEQEEAIDKSDVDVLPPELIRKIEMIPNYPNISADYLT